MTNDNKARTQAEHEAINSLFYPGTRQLCTICDDPTERCEDDSMYLDDGTGPICMGCYVKSDEYRQYQAEEAADNRREERRLGFDRDMRADALGDDL